MSNPLGILGDYTLRRQIGRGGMGVVYEVWQGSLDRQVALKVLPAGVAADERSPQRVVREAKTAAQLGHPNHPEGNKHFAVVLRQRPPSRLLVSDPSEPDDTGQEQRWGEAASAFDDLVNWLQRNGEPYVGSSVEFYLGRGTARLESGYLDGAVRDFSSVIAEASTQSGKSSQTGSRIFLEAHLLLGKTYYLMGCGFGNAAKPAAAPAPVWLGHAVAALCRITGRWLRSRAGALGRVATLSGAGAAVGSGRRHPLRAKAHARG